MGINYNFTLGKKSLMGRLLWPVNIISFVLLLSLCALIIFKVRASLEQAMASKVESISTFLQTVGQTYVTNYDIGAVENFSKIATRDNDFAYVVYIDEKGKTMTESTKIIESPDIVRIDKDIKDNSGKLIGKIVVGYRTDRINQVFWGTVTLGCIAVVLIQLLLSLAIFLVSRSIVEPLKKTLNRLSKTTGVLSNTSNGVSKFSHTLSSGVNQQAEAVQETTAAMSEMSSMLGQTSNYAKQSEVIMTSVTQKANNGMNIMNQMVDSMTSVQQANEQLQQMAEIIREITNKTNVINNIVFKTQLLSFNASIEAARAGQHGRGFAVVAEEVGKLANMSGKAAKEIASLLQDSEKQVNDIVRNTQERVKVGKGVTEQAFKNFKEIASDINLISSQISNISAAAREQELGVSQTNQAMKELNKTTELNHQIAQSASQTSRTLESEVQALNHIARAIETSITGHAESLERRNENRSSSDDMNSQSEDSSHKYDETESVDSIGDRIINMALRKRSNDNDSSNDDKRKHG